MGAYRVEEQSDGSIVIHGKRLEQLTKMTDFSSGGGVRRFKDVLEKIGLLKVLRAKPDGTSIMIGDVEVDVYL